MRKILTLTILVLLVAGAGTLVLSDTTTWSGNAEGQCGVDVEPFEPWTGELFTSGTQGAFDGYWGNDLDNEMSCTDIDSTAGQPWDADNGYWDSGGLSVFYYGTWDGYFRKSGETWPAWGSWDGTNVNCDGTWYGYEENHEPE